MTPEEEEAESKAFGEELIRRMFGKCKDYSELIAALATTNRYIQLVKERISRMTPEQESIERELYRTEMLGIMCGHQTPTEGQFKSADHLTNLHIANCKAREERENPTP